MNPKISRLLDALDEMDAEEVHETRLALQYRFGIDLGLEDDPLQGSGVPLVPLTPRLRGKGREQA